MTNYSYMGSELELFKEAGNWKAYYRQLIKNYLGSEVLEVGAGIGATTESLCQQNHRRWICLEPDPVMAKTLMALLTNGRLPEYCEQRQGTLLDISQNEIFDTIVYIDVLEHIKDDKTEVKIASSHLREGGFLVVLAPAHQWLFSDFDKAIGHYRRYNRSRLSAIVPTSLECISLRYLDSVGLMASLGNRFFLRSKMPNHKQIQLWDKGMIPLSKILDPLLQYSVGKSILGIWRKRA
jgi:2-polyprenyl-3-methyl-5-hydroxy-6-metoxy-1,4-benzoquinol methylase